MFLGGGDCVENIQTHLGAHLKSISGNHVPSADSVLHAINEFALPNITYTYNDGIAYDFIVNLKLNKLNIKSLLIVKQLQSSICYDFDW